MMLAVFLVTLPIKSFADDAVVGLLYHITRSIQFPEPTNNIDVCVFGSEADYNIFNNLDSKNGITVSVSYFSEPANAEMCHIVYVPRDASGRKKVIETVKDKPILTIGHDDFAWAGGMISTYLVGGKLVFDINFQVLQSSGVSVDAKILELGRLINR